MNVLHTYSHSGGTISNTSLIGDLMVRRVYAVLAVYLLVCSMALTIKAFLVRVGYLAQGMGYS